MRTPREASNVPTKLLYVCLDGLGDDPIPQFDGRTPLEAASTPHLDALAARGRTGTVVTVGPGIAPESDIGVFGILGYDPHEEHPGRGVLEAMGIGMDFRDGDLAYRINFATCEWPAIVDRRVGRNLTSEEAHALADEVNASLRLEGASFVLAATVEHRGALVIRTDDGAPLSAAVTNTDPAYRREGHLGVALETFEPIVATATPLEDTDAARRAADLTNRFVEDAVRVLDASDVNGRRRAEGKMPGNLILTRDAGDHLPTLEPIRTRFGLPWGCFVEMPVERGIALALGMEPVDAPRLDPTGFGPGAEEAYAVWAGLAADAFGDVQALYVHLKGPDVPAHDGRAEDKRDVIAAIDRAFFGEILPRIDDRTIVAVTADHSTSCIRAAHTADPVPLVVSGGPVPPDGTTEFGERTCATGALGELLGPQILPRIVALM
jgi:2,3-bisphosphoglycerate-independent phosphoglycerate mutase